MRFPFSKRQPAVPPRHLVIGLGNPGAEYRHTRHNVGFDVIDLLAERCRLDPRKFKLERRALVAPVELQEVPVLLVKPVTFMNLSGEAVPPLLRAAGLRPEDVIVVVDDMDLPVGKLRIRREGSAGGHNGLKSLIQHLRTTEFPRVRVGVGRPGGERATVDHVLSKFTRAELEPIREARERAADAVELIVREGVAAAMNRFNPG